jgi:hypothetical protein
MAGLDPAIHDEAPPAGAFVAPSKRHLIVDARVMPAHDARKLARLE